MLQEQWLIKPNKVQTKQKSLCMRQMRSTKDVAGTMADKAKEGTNEAKDYAYETNENYFFNLLGPFIFSLISICLFFFLPKMRLISSFLGIIGFAFGILLAS